MPGRITSNLFKAGEDSVLEGRTEKGNRQAVVTGYWSLFRRQDLFEIGLVAILFSILYFSIIEQLVNIWWSRDDFSHGFLIIPISVYLIWVKRSRLRGLTREPSILLGSIMILLAAGLLVISKAGYIITPGGISLISMLSGLILLLLGKKYLVSMAFPIGYLLFMVPFLDEVNNKLQWHFQIMTAKMSVGILQTLHFPVLLDRQYIILPKITLEVADVCSGMAYLTSIIALGLPLGYLYLNRLWARIALLASALVIGIMANWIRVALIGAWAHYNASVLHGPFHIFQGLFVSWVGFAALFIGTWVLSRIERIRARQIISETSEDPHVERDRVYSHRKWNIAWLTGVASLLVLIAWVSSFDQTSVKLKQDLQTIPLTLGDWIGRDLDSQRAKMRVKGADQEMLRVYRNGKGDEIELYVAYMEYQKSGKKLVSRQTADLFQIAKKIEVQNKGGQAVTLNGARLPGAGRWVIFWCDINGRVILNKYQAILTTILEAVSHGRSNGALVILSGPLGGSDNPELQEGAATFIQEIYPTLRAHLL